jgi:arabinoxylan arabinofuranohydrolase
MHLHTSTFIRCGSSLALVLAVLAPSPRAYADYPIASHRYLADPGVLIRDDRIYLYASNDDDNAVGGGYTISSYVCISSNDLKNWTDHGEVFRVPRNASWATNSWAPTLTERSGVIYLYFGNGGVDIGVASSTSPTGPFEDAKGSALVNSNTPGASGPDMWLFDPAVFIDDDGQAYLYFGGNGESNVRIIRLNDDMVSVNGSAISLTAPKFYEASWMHKRDGVYYFSYSTNPDGGMTIDYMTSSSPTESFVHRGTIAGQPPSNENNNHAGEFEFNGQWYHAYHNRIVSTQAGISTTYKRNLALEELNYGEDGTIREVQYTTDGLPQLVNLNPYVRVEAETMNAQSGIETEPCSAGGMNLTDLSDGDWVKLRGVDFGSDGAESFSASVASTTSGGGIELHLGTPDGALIGTCSVPSSGGEQTWAMTTCPVTSASGVKDLYLTFTGSSFKVDYWQFTPVGGGEAGAGGGPAGSGGSAGQDPGTGGGGVPSSGGGPTSSDGGVAGSAGGQVSNTGGGSPGSGGNGVPTSGGSGSGTGGVPASGGNQGTGGRAVSVSGGGPSSGGKSASGGGGSSGLGGGNVGTGAAPATTGGDAATEGAGSDAENSDGCGCTVAGRSNSSGSAIAVLLATALALGSRRRRARA